MTAFIWDAGPPGAFASLLLYTLPLWLPLSLFIYFSNRRRERKSRSSQAAARDRARRIAAAKETKEQAIAQAKAMIALGDMDGYEYLKEAQAMKVTDK